MEVCFEKMQLPYLRQVLSQTKEQELTQEVKLPEHLSDVRNILGAWGQILIRSKEWRSDSIVVNGGVLCWVMYAPEGEDMPRAVDTWLPFQMQLDMPESTEDGQISADGVLKLVDARVTGAGKIMVRACVNLQVKANVPAVAQLYKPPVLDTDIQLLQRDVVMQLPCEAGEKPFTMDEEFSLDGEPAEALLYYTLNPVIREQKVMAGKLVFRGAALIHGLYQSQSGLQSFTMDIPFAQYVQLNMDYDPDAVAWVRPAVTGLEMELTGDNRVHMKAGIVGQYVIFENKHIPLVEDAYSTERTLEMQFQELTLPNLVKEQKQAVFADFSSLHDGVWIDGMFYADHPQIQKNPEGTEAELRGRYQLLYADENGQIQGRIGKWEHKNDISDAAPTDMRLYAMGASQPSGTELEWELMTLDEKPIRIVTAFHLMEPEKAYAERPSLIVRRKGQDSLWEIAKAVGSTVEKIQQANGLEGEPAADKMLLIPT